MRFTFYLLIIAMLILNIPITNGQGTTLVECPSIQVRNLEMDLLESLRDIDINQNTSELLVTTSRGIYHHHPMSLERLSIIACREFPSGNEITEFSPNGTEIAAFLSENTGTQIFDTTIGNLLYSLRGENDPLTYVNGELGGAYPIYDLEWSPDGQNLATIGKLPLRIWNVQSETVLFEEEDFTYEPEYLYSYPPSAPYLLAWSPNGESLAVANAYRKEISFWDTSTFEHIKTWTLEAPENSAIYYLNWNKTNLLAIGGDNLPFQIWDTNTDEQLYFDENIVAHRVAWNPVYRDTLALIHGGSESYGYIYQRFLEIYNISSAQLLHSFEIENFFPTDFIWHPNGIYIYAIEQELHGEILLLNTETGEVISHYSIYDLDN